MNLQEDIIAGESIGGVRIGDQIADVSRNLDLQHIRFTESAFENFGKFYRTISIEGGKLSIVADDTNRVVRLWCCPGYQGRYKKLFYPGMTVDQLCVNSQKTLVIHGFIVIDGDFGAGFSIPEIYEGKQYDDIDYIEQLPKSMILTELHVMEPGWWR